MPLPEALAICLLLLDKEPARFELHEVHLAGLPHTLEVPPPEDRSLAQIGPQVMNEDAAVHVAAFRGGSVQPDRFHLLRG